jgi:hypothetical protein
VEADEIAKRRSRRMIRIAATAACPAICSTLPEDVSATQGLTAARRLNGGAGQRFKLNPIGIRVDSASHARQRVLVGSAKAGAATLIWKLGVSASSTKFDQRPRVLNIFAKGVSYVIGEAARLHQLRTPR